MKSFARPLAVCTVLALSLGSVVVTASAASAAEPAADLATIDLLLAAGEDVVLTADISGTDTTLFTKVDDDSTIDLAGFDLTVTGALDVAGIEIAPGSHLTIKDSVGGGVLTSTGNDASAGIGGGSSHPDQDERVGSLEIVSGTVIATGGQWNGAGIGGSGWRKGPSVTISGGDVTATSRRWGAGIGAGFNRMASPIVISGGTVTAVGGEDGAAIGGSAAGQNSSVVISGGDVTLSAMNQSVLGKGFQYAENPMPEWAFGSVAITGGRVTVSEGSFLEIPRTKTIVNSGTIVNYGDIRGEGTLANAGAVIGFGDVTTDVTGRDYFVSYDALGGTVDAASIPLRAASFYDAGRSLPQPTHSSLPFSSWNTEANGTGAVITPETDVSAVFPAAGAEPSEVTLYAMYGSAPFIETSTLNGAVRGQDYSASLDVVGDSAIDFSILAGDLPDGLVLDAEDGTISGTPGVAGLFDFSVLAHNEGGSDIREFSIDVQREAKTLTIAAPKAPAAVGTKVTVPVSGLDAGEPFTVSYGTKTLATGKANAAGKASPKITVPAVSEGARTVRVVGSNLTRTGVSSLQVVSSTKKFSVSTNKKTYHYGQKVTITVKNLAAGEKVAITFRGKTITSSKAVASAKGTYTITYSAGSTKGTKNVTVTGAKSTRAGSTSVKVKK